MLQIHEFWVQMFPIFQNDYEFVYVFFDVVSIISMIKIFFTLPVYLLGSVGRIKW